MSERYISPLFIGLTRPAMLLGVNVEFIGIELVVAMMVWSITANPVYLVVVLPLHLFGVICCLFDPHCFRILAKRLQCGITTNRKIWKSDRYEAF